MKMVMALALLALTLLPAFAAGAQDTATAAVTPTAATTGTVVFPNVGLIVLGACVGAGLIIIGAARGIGSIGSHAVDAIARQPEAGGRIFTSMIISAALIEGATLFAVVICLLASFRE